jgi:hypothetical protein
MTRIQSQSFASIIFRAKKKNKKALSDLLQGREGDRDEDLGLWREDRHNFLLHAAQKVRAENLMQLLHLLLLVQVLEILL